MEIPIIAISHAVGVPHTVLFVVAPLTLNKCFLIFLLILLSPNLAVVIKTRLAACDVVGQDGWSGISMSIHTPGTQWRKLKWACDC